MKTVYLLVKKKSNFCTDTDQFKNLLSTNNRLTFSDETKLNVDNYVLGYNLSMTEVEKAGEYVFHLEVIANQEKEDGQINALEAFDTILSEINSQYKIFSINTVWDDVSLYYGRNLYPKIAEIESLLREIIYLFMLKHVGSEWLSTRAPQQVKEELNDTAKKNHKEELPKTDPLVYAEFITLETFFFTKYSISENFDELFQILNNETLTEEKIEELKELYVPKSNWERYFSDLIPGDKFKNKWYELYNYRNQVAHTKKINKTDYKKANKIIDELKPKFTECLEHMDEVELTDGQSNALEEIGKQFVSSFGITLEERTKDLFDGFDLSSIVLPFSRSLFSLEQLASQYAEGLTVPSVSGELTGIPVELTVPSIGEDKETT